jgi:hypothetical protein
VSLGEIKKSGQSAQEGRLLIDNYATGCSDRTSFIAEQASPARLRTTERLQSALPFNLA